MIKLHESLLVEEPQGFSETSFNYARTFKFMTKRRLQRQFKGIYPGPSKVMSLLAQLVWTYAVVVMMLAGVASSGSLRVTLASAWRIIGSLFIVIFIANELRSRLLLLMVYCAVAAHASFFAISGDAGLFELSVPKLGQSTALIVLVAIEAVILIAYFLIFAVYPAVISREWIDTLKWLDVKRGRRANTIVYRAISVHRIWRPRKQFTIQYTGGLDRDFRPHGFGVWKDTWYHGETLSGAWEHGIPIGPFTSQEHGSGYASQQIRIAYASYRSETKMAAMNLRPRFPADKKLRWGVARMECSVAGGFFHFLPQVEYFFDRANAPQSARDCVSTLRTPLDNVFYRDTETHRVVSGHPVSATSFRETLEPTAVSADETNAVRNAEALVFVHGIFNSAEDATKLFGQLLARGDFPSEIHPFLFSWASGNFAIPSYWAAKRNAESEEVATALSQFVSSIIDAGYTKVHFITHSMGARVFLNTVERNAFKSLFENGPTRAQASIASVTLCSPEFPLARFVAAGGVYDVLREYCSLITIFGDKWDLALRSSELANRDWKLCSRLIGSLGCRVDSVVRGDSFPAPQDCVYVSVGAFDTSTTTATSSVASVNKTAGFRQVTGVMQCDPAPPASTVPGSEPQSYGSVLDYDNDAGDSKDAKPRVYLDVDVVNTSFADTNVGNRHSYFRVNESIVEDIRELVLHGRRAKARAGLMRQQGNMFVFLSAPKDIL